MGDEGAESGNTKRFFGWLLVCGGGLILTLSGLCTLVASVAEVTAPRHMPNGAVNIFNGPQMLIFVIPIGLFPMGIGVALLLWGRKILGRMG